MATATDRVIEEQRGVARFLADVVERERGEEQANVLTVLLGVVDDLGSAVSPIAPRLADAVSSYALEQPLREEHLLGAFQLAVNLERPASAALLQVLINQGFFNSRDRIIRAADALDQVPPAFQDELTSAIEVLAEQQPELLAKPLARLPRERAEQFAGERLRKELLGRLRSQIDEGDVDEARQIVDALRRAILDRNEPPEGLGGSLIWLLLLVERQPAYAIAREWADELREGMPRGQIRNSHSLLALGQAPSEDWPYWIEDIDADSPSFERQGGWSVDAFLHLIRDVSASENLDEAFIEAAASKLSRFVTAEASEEKLEELISGIDTALSERNWYGDAEARRTQERLHVALRPLTEGPDAISTRVTAARVADLERALNPPAGQGVEERADGVIQMSRNLPASALREIAGHANGLATSGPDGQVQALRVRAALANAVGLRDGGEPDGPFAFPDDELAVVMEVGVAERDQMLETWLSLNPDPHRILQIVRRLGGSPSSRIRRAVGTWSAGRSMSDRTAVVSDLTRLPFDSTVWIGAIAEHRIDDEQIVDELAEAVTGEGSGDRRGELVSELVAVRPSTGRSQRAVAELMLSLLATGKKNDLTIALDAARALGNDHRSAGRLKDAIKEATERHGYKIPPKAAEALAAAGVRPAKKSLRQDAVDRLKSIFG